MRKAILLLFTILLVTNLKAQLDLTLMTYNIRYDNPRDGENRWDLRKEWLTNQVLFVEPDVMGIQEGLSHQVNFINKALTTYEYVGIGRDDGKTKGEYAAIFYNNKTLSLIDQSTFWLSPTPGKPSVGWDAAMERICTYAIFESKNTSQRFLVFNAHFDHIGKVARSRSIDLILEKIMEINQSNLPVFLMGDLNLEPETEPIQKLSKRMNDSFTHSINPAFGPIGTFNGFKHDKSVNRRIDYIFSMGSQIQVSKYAVLSDSKDMKYPSDHLPVVIKATLRR